MVIKASSAADIRSLIEALGSSDPVRRESAVARLAVIGSRAADRLIRSYGSTSDPLVQVGILRALETMIEPRALQLASLALDAGGDPAVAAAAVLKPFLESNGPGHAATALDALVEAALDVSKEHRVRLAAYEALQDMPADLLEKVGEVVRTPVPGARREDAVHEAVLADAIDGRLPGDPGELGHAVVARGPSAALGSLQKVIDAVRTRERSENDAATRLAWQQVRGTAHQVLALRGSRIALYDLRETVETAAEPLPPSFLSAMRAVGDASCVEPLAAALARAPELDLWWRHQLASALRGIARRERITRRHASMKRVLARWPQAAAALT
jgi:hypothetical protein